MMMDTQDDPQAIIIWDILSVHQGAEGHQVPAAEGAASPPAPPPPLL